MKKLLAAIVAAVVAGVILWVILPENNGYSPSHSRSNGPDRSSFLEQVSGNYHLVSWEEAHNPITLYIDAKQGTLSIDNTGEARWELYIQQRGESGTPQSRIRCKGRVLASSRRLEHVGGSGNAAINWDSNIESVRDSVWLTFAGSTVGGGSDPFSLHIEPSGGSMILTMRNSRGTFTWRK
jgi:hypothetical protein